MPMLGSYTLYRFDCALRASAILGLVGAGGLGLQLELSMKMFAYHEVAAQVIALFALVAAADQASQYVRQRLQRSRGWIPSAVPGRLLMIAVWAGAFIAAGAFLRLPVRDLFSGEAVLSILSFSGSLFPPELRAPFLASLGPAVFETISMSILGTAIAAVLGLVLAYPAAARLELALSMDRPMPWIERATLRAFAWGARGLLNLSRTLPELLWALIFIFVVGLGPFAGALALGVHTAGVLGRLYAEALEEVPRGPLLALRSAGAARGGAALLALLPQAFPQLVAYTLYRWEVNIRASAVLGIVGAGGLGKALYLSLSLFQHHRTLTLIAVTVAVVTAVDLFSSWLRRRVQEGGARTEDADEAVELEAPGSAHAW
jgi:phosphonate transport system permease protein